MLYIYTIHNKNQWQALVNFKTKFLLSKKKDGKFHDKLNDSQVIQTDYALVTCLPNLRYTNLYYPKIHKISSL